MADQQRENLGRRGAGDTSGGRVVPLSQLDEYEIAEGYPDIRGWDVKEGSRKVGDIHELLVDMNELRVRYLDVRLDRGLASAGDRHVLIPVGNVTLDDRRDDVVLSGVSASQLGTLTPYTHAGLTREYEASLLSGLGLGAGAGAGAGDFYGVRHFDDSRLFAGRRQVPVTREEVEIERRPIRSDAKVGRTEIREDEVRGPLTAEEVVAEKRVVPKEQVIIASAR